MAELVASHGVGIGLGFWGSGVQGCLGCVGCRIKQHVIGQNKLHILLFHCRPRRLSFPCFSRSARPCLPERCTRLDAAKTQQSSLLMRPMVVL